MNVRERFDTVTTALTKRLGLDVGFYSRSFSWLSLGHGSGIIRGIATTFLMARWLPQETMGQFRYILSIFSVAGIFSLTGVSASVIRGVAKGDTVVIRMGIKRILQIAPLGSLVLLGAGVERFFHGEILVAWGFVIAAAIFPLYCVSGMYTSILTGEENIPKLVRSTAINNLVFAICFIIVLTHSKSLPIIALAYFGFDVLFRGFLTYREVRRVPSKGSAEEHLRLGTHMSAIGVFQTIAHQLDQILIQRFFGYGALASYSIATLIPEQIKDFINAIGGTVLRRFSRHEYTQSITRQARRHFWSVCALAVILTGGYCLVAPFAFPWLFPNYADKTSLSMVYALGLIAVLPVLVGTSFLQAHNQIRSLWRYFTTNSVLQAATSLLFIPFFGVWGAIFSKTSTRFLSFMLSYPPYPPKKPEDTKPNEKLQDLVNTPQA